MRAVNYVRRNVFALIAGAIAFGSVYLIDLLLVRMHMAPEATILDELLVAVVIGLLVILREQHHQRELQQQQERMAVVIEMNHHIRNALQTIVYLTPGLPNEDAARMMDATKRIEWALTEVLPGERSVAAKSASQPSRGNG